MIKCVVCNNEYKAISRTHLKRHGITFGEYKTISPDAKTVWNNGLQPSPEELERRKEARRQWLKEHRSKNRDKLILYRREWRRRPEVKERERAKRQSPEGRKYGLERARRYRKENPEKYDAYHKQWYQENRERLLVNGREYHSRLEVKERDRRVRLLRKYGENSLKILEEDNYACRKCGSTNRIGIHHIDWNDTNNEFENLVVLCDSCHQKLHLFIPLQFRKPVFEGWLIGNAEVQV